MKPGPLAYERAESMEHAATLLAEYGDDAKIIAGGQSLVPLMNLRLARPAYLVDIGRADGADQIVADGEGRTIGAMVTERVVEHSPTVAGAIPLLTEAMGHVGHPQIRNRGTLVGSLTHNDPAAELPPVALVCDARLTLRNADGTRVVDAADFLTHSFTTATRPDEVVDAVWFPDSPGDCGEALVEFSRRPGDFAVAGVACRLTVSEHGDVRELRIALLGAGPVATRMDAVERDAVGQPAHDDTWESVAAAVAAQCEPPADLHGDADYRRRLVRRLTGHALRTAWQRAPGGTP